MDTKNLQEWSLRRMPTCIYSQKLFERRRLIFYQKIRSLNKVFKNDLKVIITNATSKMYGLERGLYRKNALLRNEIWKCSFRVLGSMVRLLMPSLILFLKTASWFWGLTLLVDRQEAEAGVIVKMKDKVDRIGSDTELALVIWHYMAHGNIQEVSSHNQ
jgi:hypothetical protein